MIDVRTVPRSRTNPQYNVDVLADGLRPWQVSYERIAELGGLRSKSHAVPEYVNGLWKNQSFHNYADYALTSEFQTGLDRLVALASERRAAIMCAEAVWWRCHRRIIADYLLARGWQVYHLMGVGRSDPAVMTSGARELDGHIVYPARATSKA